MGRKTLGCGLRGGCCEPLSSVHREGSATSACSVWQRNARGSSLHRRVGNKHLVGRQLAVSKLNFPKSRLFGNFSHSLQNYPVPTIWSSPAANLRHTWVTGFASYTYSIERMKVVER